jgi:hypothetical protein
MPTDEANSSPSPRFGAMHLLVAANIAALGLLAIVELSAAAKAQQRPRGTFTAASGRIEGTETHALYVIDEATQEMIAVQWDPRAKQVKGLGYRSMGADMGDIAKPRSN